MNTFVKNFKKWLEVENQRIAIQRVYLAITIAVFSSSAVVSLFDNSLGRQVLLFASLSLLVFITNSIIWALSQAILASSKPIETKAKSKNR